MWKHIWLLMCCPLLAGSLSGRVTDGQGNGIEVGITALDTELLCIVGATSSDASGNYSLEEIPDGTYYLIFDGENVVNIYHGNTGTRNVTEAAPVVVNGDVSLDLTARLGAEINGNVTVNGGNVSDVRVVLVDPFTLLEGDDFSTQNGSAFSFEGVPSGCYMIGAIYDPGGNDLGTPVGWYGGGVLPLNATLLNVVEGQSYNNIDLTVDVGALGTLRVSVTAPELEGSASINLFSSDNVPFAAMLNPNGATDLLLPPGTYRLFLDYDDSYITQLVEGTVTITAGNVNSQSYTAVRGGVATGQVSYSPTSISPGETITLELLEADSGAVVQSQTINLTDPDGFSNFRFSGLEDDTYTIRANSAAGGIDFLTIFEPGFQRRYLGNADSLGDASTFTVTNGNNHPNKNIPLTRGQTITGALTGAENALFLSVDAINENTNEVYQGSYISEFGYFIKGLPPGDYKVGVSTGFFSSPSLGSYLGFLNGLFCRNLGPSYYNGADTLEAATTVSVSNIPVSDIDVDLRPGGLLRGRLIGNGCDCPLGQVLLAVYEGNRIVNFTFTLDGIFEIGGLPDGNYTLRALVLDPRDANLFNEFANLQTSDINDVFDILTAYTFSQTVTASSGVLTDLGDWCIDIGAFTSGGTGGGGGGGGGGGTDNAVTLVYPWISNNAGQFESILIVNNLGDAPVDVTMTATRGDGTNQTIEETIPANGFLREQASALFDVLGSGPGYTVVLTGDGDLRGRWVTNNLTSATGNSPSQGVAVRVPDSGATQRVGEDLIFGYLPKTNNFTSAPVIVNVGDGPTDITLSYYNAAGVRVSQETTNGVAPNTPIAFLAPGDENIYMVAESDSEPLTGVAFVFNNVGETAIGNASSVAVDGSDTGMANLLYSWISNNTNQFESILVANNFGDSQATVTLTARRNNGETQTVQRVIPSDGFLEENASTLFPTLGSGPGYTVELSADTSKIAGGWVTNNLTAESGASPSQGVAVDLSNPSGQRIGDAVLFGFLPLTNDFVSAPVVVNAGDAATDVTLTFYDTAGTMVAQDTTTLAAAAPLLPFAAIAGNLVPAGSGDVYMVARSSDGTPLTGVVFVFNSEGETAIGNVTRVD